MDQPQQAPPMHTHVHAISPAANGLAVGGLVVSVIGWFSCGLLCPIGAILSAVALKKEPKGLAIAGLIIGLIGSVVSLIVLIVFGGLIATFLAAIGLGVVAFEQAHEQQQAAQPAAQAIYHYYETNGRLPNDIQAAAITAPFAHEGHPFVLETHPLADTFYLKHPGDDGQWDTHDDWSTYWDITDLRASSPSAPPSPFPSIELPDQPADEPAP